MQRQRRGAAPPRTPLRLCRRVFRHQIRPGLLLGRSAPLPPAAAPPGSGIRLLV